MSRISNLRKELGRILIGVSIGTLFVAGILFPWPTTEYTPPDTQMVAIAVLVPVTIAETLNLIYTEEPPLCTELPKAPPYGQFTVVPYPCYLEIEVAE